MKSSTLFEKVRYSEYTLVSRYATEQSVRELVWRRISSQIATSPLVFSRVSILCVVFKGVVGLALTKLLAMCSWLRDSEARTS